MNVLSSASGILRAASTGMPLLRRVFRLSVVDGNGRTLLEPRWFSRLDLALWFAERAICRGYTEVDVVVTVRHGRKYLGGPAPHR